MPSRPTAERCWTRRENLPASLSFLLFGLALLLLSGPVAAQDHDPSDLPEPSDEISAPTAPMRADVNFGEEVADDLEAEEEVDTGADRPGFFLDVAERLEDETEESEAPEDPERPDAVPISLPAGEDRSAVTPQALSLPDGGGTIEGMGESFQALLSSGQASFSVPIALPGGRAGLGPGLGLGYSTGGGNSMVGVGWSIGVPFIARQTDRGLPRYDRSSLDRFIYNGGQELVPIAYSGDDPPHGEQWPDFTSGGGWTYFRARIEGAFMRFFLHDDERQWVVQNTNGTLYFFGEQGSGTSNAIIDFEEGGEIFVYRWNLTAVVDTSGNRVEYRYEQYLSQSYLTHVYWNNPPGDSDSELTSYQHHVELQYETRPDPYFSYTSGFRIETARRLVYVFVESVPFDEPPGSDYAHTRTYSLDYDGDSTLSLLTRVQLHGRGCHNDRFAGCSVEENGSLPAMELSYTGLDGGLETVGYGNLNDAVWDVAESPTQSVSEARSDFFDANGDGMPDLLVTDPAR